MTVRRSKPPGSGSDPDKITLSIEIFVRPGFSHLELSSVISVLQAANMLETATRFTWQITSDLPGLVSSSSEVLVRAEPVIGIQYLKDCLFVVGGKNCGAGNWLPRVRAMQRSRRPVFLLSEAATEYIRASAPLSGPATTHWQDVIALSETGDYPTISHRLAEDYAGIVTCAGRGHTSEIVIQFLTSVLAPQDCSELASVMVLEEIRGFLHEQPIGISGNEKFLGNRLTTALSVMEGNIENPLSTAEIAECAGTSIRHLERLFMQRLNTTPGKFYKKVRLKLACRLIDDTDLPMMEVAQACGFTSSSTFSKAYRDEYGRTPHQVRTNRKTKLTAYDPPHLQRSSN